MRKQREHFRISKLTSQKFQFEQLESRTVLSASAVDSEAALGLVTSEPPAIVVNVDTEQIQFNIAADSLLTVGLSGQIIGQDFDVRPMVMPTGIIQAEVVKQSGLVKSILLKKETFFQIPTVEDIRIDFGSAGYLLLSLVDVRLRWASEFVGIPQDASSSIELEPDGPPDPLGNRNYTGLLAYQPILLESGEFRVKPFGPLATLLTALGPSLGDIYDPATNSILYSVTESGSLELGFGWDDGSISVRTNNGTINGLSILPNLAVDGLFLDRGIYEVDISVAGSIVAEPLNMSPVARAGGPYSIQEGRSLILDASSSTDPEGNPLTFAWDINGDGVFQDAAGVNPTVTWQQLLDLGVRPGLWNVRVRARDSSGDSDISDVTPFEVVNLPPVGFLVNDGFIQEGRLTTVSFNNVEDATPGVRFAFDLDDDGTIDVGSLAYALASTNRSASFVPPDNGLRRVRGYLLDAYGGVSESTNEFNVLNSAPTGVVPNVLSQEGGTATVGFINVTDTSAIDATSLRFAFDIDDDGIIDVGALDYEGAAENRTIQLQTPDSGERLVRAFVFDKDGARSGYLVRVTIANTEPQGVFSNGGAVTEGSMGSVSFSSLFDPSPSDSASLRFAYDIGDDGVIDVGSLDYASATTDSAIDVFAADSGLLFVKGYVIDPDGSHTAYLTAISVLNASPSLTIFGPSTALRGTATTFTIVPDDPSPVDLESPFTYAIDFDGDNHFDEFITTSGPWTVSHVYESVGSYQIRVFARDKDGALGTGAPSSVDVRSWVTQVDEQGLSNLLVAGTSGDDDIWVLPSGIIAGVPNASSVQIYNFADPATDIISAQVDGKIFILGYGGNDRILADLSSIGLPTSLFTPVVLIGGSGNDTLVGGQAGDWIQGDAGDDVLIGGWQYFDGNDVILGGDGRDLIVGGFGTDVLLGGAGSDLIVASAMSLAWYQTDFPAVWSEWLSSDSYAIRVPRVLGILPGGLNGAATLSPFSDTFDDAVADYVLGQSELDWLIADIEDDGLGDRIADEFVFGI